VSDSMSSMSSKTDSKLPEQVRLAVKKPPESPTTHYYSGDALSRILDMPPLRLDGPAAMDTPWRTPRMEWVWGVGYPRTSAAVLYIPPAVVSIQLPDALDDLIARDVEKIRRKVSLEIAREYGEKSLSTCQSIFAYEWSSKYFGELLSPAALRLVSFRECRRVVRRLIGATVYRDLRPVIRRSHVVGDMYWHQHRRSASGTPEEVVLPPNQRYVWVAAHEAAHAVTETHYGRRENGTLCGHGPRWWGVWRRMLAMVAGAQLERIDRTLTAEGIEWVEPVGLWRS
jgi:hypothetical protein